MSRRSAGLLALVLALVAALAGPVAAKPGPSRQLVPGLPVYMALGDSVANGEGSVAMDPPTTAAEYWANVRAWRANGYVSQVHDYLVDNLDCLPAKGAPAQDGCRHLQLRNLSRSAIPDWIKPGFGGVTTPDLIAQQLPRATRLLKARNQDANPRNDVEVVTVTVGGNDMFESVLKVCLVSPEACQAAIPGAFAAFVADFTTVLAELRAAAGPDTPIVAMTYYNPFVFDPAVPSPCVYASPGNDAFGDLLLEGGTPALPLGFNDLIRMVSAQHGATVAETFGLLGSDDMYDCKHPDGSGHAKIATAFEAAITG